MTTIKCYSKITRHVFVMHFVKNVLVLMILRKIITVFQVLIYIVRRRYRILLLGGMIYEKSKVIGHFNNVMSGVVCYSVINFERINLLEIWNVEKVAIQNVQSKRGLYDHLRVIWISATWIRLIIYWRFSLHDDHLGNSHNGP